MVFVLAIGVPFVVRNRAECVQFRVSATVGVFSKRHHTRLLLTSQYPQHKRTENECQQKLDCMFSKCYTVNMNIGFAREIRGLTVKTQLLALGRADCYRVWDETNGEGLAECIDAMRKGDTLAVYKLPVLSTPAAGRPSRKHRPRDRLRHFLKLLSNKGAGIWETASDRRFDPDDTAVDAIFEAIDHWSSNSGRAGGRPKVHDYSDDERKIIAGYMRDRVNYKNHHQRIKALRQHGPDDQPKRFARFNYAAWRAMDRQSEMEPKP